MCIKMEAQYKILTILTRGAYNLVGFPSGISLRKLSAPPASGTKSSICLTDFSAVTATLSATGDCKVPLTTSGFDSIGEVLEPRTWCMARLLLQCQQIMATRFKARQSVKVLQYKILPTRTEFLLSSVYAFSARTIPRGPEQYYDSHRLGPSVYTQLCWLFSKTKARMNLSLFNFITTPKCMTIRASTSNF